MTEEYEVRFLEIDVDEITKKLESIKAQKQFNSLFKIRAFYVNEHDDQDFIRLRDEGDKITLCHKKAKEGGDIKSEEYEIEVNDFERTLEFINSLGYKEKTAIEKRRTRYKIGDGIIDIDTWPKIPTYLEVEAESEEKIIELCKKLDLDYEKSYNGNAYDVYRKYGIEPNEYKVLTFEKIEKF